jgi:hypothetical protein
MCKFNKAWIGICNKENIIGEEYCEEHLQIKCSVCGEQATHDCHETNQFVCGTPLCDKLDCKLIHFYQSHGYAFGELVELEKELNITPFKIIVSKINYGIGKFAEWCNENYRDRLEVLLMTYDKNNNVKFYNAQHRYYIKFKEEIIKLFEYSWYEEIIKEKGIYYSENPIYIQNKYLTDIIDTFEKVL